MADTEVQQLHPGVTVERTPGYAPIRKDNRSIMEMLRDEFNKHLGVDPKHGGRTYSEIVDKGVEDGTGANPDY